MLSIYQEQNGKP